MIVIDVKMINNKCEVLVKQDTEKVKYNLSLNNPKLIKYLNMFLEKKTKELEEATIDMESDYFLKSFRDGIFCYGISGLLATGLLANTLYAPEAIGMLGTFGACIIVTIGHLIKKSIEYDADPKKKAKVDKIESEIGEIKKNLELVKQKVLEKKQQDEKEKKAEEMRKFSEEHQKKQEEIRRYLQEKRIQNIRSSKFTPNEVSLFDEVVHLAKSCEEYYEIPEYKIRDIIKKKFLEKKEEDPDRRNTDILREMVEELTSSYNTNRRK